MSIIPGWPLRPIEDRVRALRYASGTWDAVDYTDLRPGDIFKPVNPQGEDIDPFTLEPCEDNVSIALGEPVPAIEQGNGYSIEVEHIGTLKDALARAR